MATLHEKTDICSSTVSMATKPGRVVTYDRKTPPTKLRDLLITWSRGKCKTLHLHFNNTYDHQTWQSDNLWWWDPNFKVTWPFDYVDTWQMKKSYICISTISMASKLRRVAYGSQLTVGRPHPLSNLTFWSRSHVTNVVTFHNTHGYQT